MGNRVVHLQRESSEQWGITDGEVLDAAVIEAILDVPAADTHRLLASVAATLEDAVIGHLEAIDALVQPHLIILKAPALAAEIKASAQAAGATGVARAAADIEALVASATGDVSRDRLLALVGECHAALQGYLTVVFERYLVAR